MRNIHQTVYASNCNRFTVTLFISITLIGNLYKSTTWDIPFINTVYVNNYIFVCYGTQSSRSTKSDTNVNVG